MLFHKALHICAKFSQQQSLRNIKKMQKFPPFAIHWRCISSNVEDTKNQTRIYCGSLTPRVKAVKIFSLTTSLTGLAAQPILMDQGAKLGGTVLAVFLCGFVGFFTFVTPFLLHIITKRYVTEIHYNNIKDEYTATTLSFFLRKIQTKFQVKDVRVPDVPGMLTSFLANGTPLFVDPLQFTDTEHYIKIMGYDKPIDFKLNLDESSKNRSKQ